ncbi:signal peptidase complex subunit SPC2 [Sporobolomyces koalae]|uniref:signal peptidase complex subunit SPC2 n=1 Tax=Sporobolomyces koalae TaxID=500713 RepID=UPI003181E74B
MARKQAAEVVRSSSSGEEPSLPASERWLPQVEVTKINPLSLLELKTTLDDLVKEFFSLPRHNFTRSYRHEDLRLGLGWSSVVIALAVSYYAYKLDNFEQSKPIVATGVVSYVVLNTILALYVQYVEQNTIFVAKRRTLASRITTEVLEISSVASSSPNHSTVSSWIPFPLSLLSKSPRPPVNGESSQATVIDRDDYPVYTLTLEYRHSANANKSILHQQSLVESKPVRLLFDQQGRVARDRVEEWLKGAMNKVMGQNSINVEKPDSVATTED